MLVVAGSCWCVANWADRGGLPPNRVSVLLCCKRVVAVPSVTHLNPSFNPSNSLNQARRLLFEGAGDAGRGGARGPRRAGGAPVRQPTFAPGPMQQQQHSSCPVHDLGTASVSLMQSGQPLTSLALEGAITAACLLGHARPMRTLQHFFQPAGRLLSPQLCPGPLGAVQGQHGAPGQAVFPQPSLHRHPHVSVWERLAGSGVGRGGAGRALGARRGGRVGPGRSGRSCKACKCIELAFAQLTSQIPCSHSLLRTCSGQCIIPGRAVWFRHLARLPTHPNLAHLTFPPFSEDNACLWRFWLGLCSSNRAGTQWRTLRCASVLFRGVPVTIFAAAVGFLLLPLGVLRPLCCCCCFWVFLLLCCPAATFFA